MSNITEHEECYEFYDLMPNDLTLTMEFKVNFVLASVAIIIVSLLANACVILALIAHRVLRTARNLYVANLAIADLLTTITCLPITTVSLIYKRWYFGQILCKLIPSLQALAVVVSAFSLTLVAIDRYFVIVHNKHTRYRTAYTATCCAWLLATAISTPIGYFQLEKEIGLSFVHDGSQVIIHMCGQYCVEEWPNAHTKSAYSLFLSFLQYVLPLTIICKCYISTYHAIKTNAARIARNTAREQGRLCSMVRAKRIVRRTNRIFVLIVASFALCWFPHILLNVLKDLELWPTEVQVHDYFISACTHAVSMAFCAINPLVFIATNKRFQLCRKGTSAADRTAYF